MGLEPEASPLVSAICSVWQSEEYLDALLSSLPEQSLFPHFEFMLDLNAPSLAELQIARSWQEKLPHVLKVHSTAQLDPIYVSWNRSIRSSKGDYLAIWNIDDLRSPNSLEAQLSCFVDSPEASAVYGPYTVVRKFGDTKGRLVDIGPEKGIDFSTGMYLGPFMMFRRSVVLEVGYFDEQLKSGADFDFAVRLAMVGEMRDCGAHLGYYLNAGKGASTGPASLQLVERTVVQLRYGITQGLDMTQVPLTYNYSIPHIKCGDDLIPISDLLGGYREMVETRLSRYLAKTSVKIMKLIYKYSERFTILIQRARFRYRTKSEFL